MFKCVVIWSVRTWHVSECAGMPLHIANTAMQKGRARRKARVFKLRRTEWGMGKQERADRLLVSGDAGGVELARG
eukprot:303852-Rhodomonas_salina.5